MGVVHIHGQQRQVALVQLADHRLQGFPAGQGDIPVQDQHPGIIRQVRQGLCDGMAGAQLFGLEYPVHRLIVEGSTHLIRTMADHRVNFLRPELLGGIHHVMQHGFAGHRVQNLGQCGLHSGTLAGGQDHDV